jgi:hypothetical protein
LFVSNNGIEFKEYKNDRPSTQKIVRDYGIDLTELERNVRIESLSRLRITNCEKSSKRYIFLPKKLRFKSNESLKIYKLLTNYENTLNNDITI